MAPTIAIFDISYPAARWMAWAARHAGCNVRIYAPPGFNITRISRLFPKLKRCPSPEALEPFHAWASQKIADGEFDFIAPTSDMIVFHIARLLPQIREPWRSRLTSSAQLLNCVFKDQFISSCRQQGVPVPRTAIAQHQDALIDEARDQVGFPAIAKPRSHVAMPGERGGLVNDVDELRRLLQEYERYVQNRTGLAPDVNALPIIQQYLPAAKTSCISVSGLIQPGGEIRQISASRKLAQAPPTCGIGILFERVDDEELKQTGSSYAKKLLDMGLFELEIIPDPDSGTQLAIDLNPRAFGQMPLDICNGATLPLDWLNQVLDSDAQPEFSPTPSRYAYHSALFPFAYWWNTDIQACDVDFMKENPVSLGKVPGDFLGNLAYTLRSGRRARGMLRAPNRKKFQEPASSTGKQGTGLYR